MGDAVGTGVETLGSTGSTLAVDLRGPVHRSDVARLCDELRSRLARAPARVVVCDVAGVMRPDATTVDALARLQLTARRSGASVVLHGAGPELRGLLALVGLSRVVPARSDVEVVGQSEVREELGADEVRDADDPAVLDP